MTKFEELEYIERQAELVAVSYLNGECTQRLLIGRLGLLKKDRKKVLTTPNTGDTTVKTCGDCNHFIYHGLVNPGEKNGQCYFDPPRLKRGYGIVRDVYANDTDKACGNENKEALDKVS